MYDNPCLQGRETRNSERCIEERLEWENERRSGSNGIPRYASKIKKLLPARLELAIFG